MEIIRTDQVEKIYSDTGVPVHALSSVSIDIGKGDFTVIAGPSGSGKTTLLNMIGTLDVPTEGKVYFEREDIALKTRAQLANLRLNKIGFIFQAYNLIPVLTALENVEFTMVLLRVPERQRYERAMAVMEELGIVDLANKRPNKMSGGQQQRVAIARAIVTNPSVVLADEPTANLDSAMGIALLELMERLNHERQITFVFSSHDPQVIQRGHRVVILRDGRIESDRIIQHQA
ncbi:MAG: ABC transporter ATP-binding protein [bacterium]